MYDAIDVMDLPADGNIYAGYVNGDYVTVTKLLSRFPGIPILTIDVKGNAHAQCLDVETGDATVEDIDPWLEGYALKGPVFDLPVIYMNLNTAKVSFPETHPSGCLLWTAHYTNVAHICGESCGLKYSADMTQWKNNANTYDQSLVNPAHYIFGKGTEMSGVKTVLQGSWEYCSKCKGLFYGPDAASSHCPDGGTHDGSGSYAYFLMANAPS